MSKYSNILWMDLEMTGLDPQHDRILEVAVIVTDWDLKEIKTFEVAVKVDEALLEERMEVSRAFWDANPAVRDDLILRNASEAKVSELVEDRLLELLDEHCASDAKVLLAGNSIHQDRRFIAAQWKRLDARLHYRMLDVTAWKVVFENKFKKRFAKPEEHRALADIRGSISELAYYLGKIKP